MTRQALHRAVFLDRDGTINPDTGYISRADDFDVYPYAAQAIKLLKEHNYLVFVVTNQSGIARGMLTFADLDQIHKKMTRQLAAEGAYVDGIFVSPYYEKGTVAPYNVFSEDRKPGLGLFKQAQKQFPFSAGGSFMVGDRYGDIAFGKKAGMKMVLVRSGEGDRAFLEDRHQWEMKPDYVVKDLLAAARLIIFCQE